MASQQLSCNAADNSFGPAIPLECRGGFGFTLLFEQTILSISPCALFLLVSWFQLARVRKSASVVPPRGTLYFANKVVVVVVVVVVVYAALQLAVLAGSTLLRLLIPPSGRVFIDGIDTSTLPGDLVRARITTVPQDPYFPPSRSLRHSLSSPGSQHQDSDVLEALRRVGILSHVVLHLGGETAAAAAAAAAATEHNVVESLGPGATGRILEARMRDLPLSAGQLQLFALAHAMLQRHRRIVLLDEVTSAMDQDAEERSREVLRDGEAFGNRTVVMIAHRLEMLALCDTVVELDSGRVVNIKEK